MDISGLGMYQGDLVDLLVDIRATLNGILTKLDADSAVTDEDYNSTYAVSLPDGFQTVNPKAIRDQGAIVTLLNDWITNFNLVLTKLDNDTGVADENYNSLWAVTDIVGNSKIDGIVNTGIYQSNLVFLLNNIITNIAGLNDKLDDDGTVNNTNYASLWDIADTVIEAGTTARPR